MGNVSHILQTKGRGGDGMGEGVSDDLILFYDKILQRRRRGPRSQSQLTFQAAARAAG